MAEQEIRQLKQIKRELEEIKERTGNPRRSFVSGIFYGAGAFIGGILAVTLIGWLLSFLGIIPGLGELVTYLQDLINQLPRK